MNRTEIIIGDVIRAINRPSQHYVVRRSTYSLGRRKEVCVSYLKDPGRFFYIAADKLNLYEKVNP